MVPGRRSQPPQPKRVCRRTTRCASAPELSSMLSSARFRSALYALRYKTRVTDPRVERLGDLVVNYSLELREGQVVRIDGLEIAAPLALATYRAALEIGAHPYTNLSIDGLLELV